MPAEREEVFSSMKESLDKIAASTAAMENFFSGTLEENIEGNRAQKLRDKEQQKQTEALEKLGKSQGKAEKESSFLGKHWGKLLLGLLGLLALMTKWKTITDAFEWVMENPIAATLAGLATAIAAFKAIKAVMKAPGAVARSVVRKVKTGSFFEKTKDIKPRKTPVTIADDFKTKASIVDETKKTSRFQAEPRKVTRIQVKPPFKTFGNERILRVVDEPHGNPNRMTTKITGKAGKFPGTSPLVDNSKISKSAVERSLELAKQKTAQVAPKVKKVFNEAADSVKKLTSKAPKGPGAGSKIAQKLSVAGRLAIPAIFADNFLEAMTGHKTNVLGSAFGDAPLFRKDVNKPLPFLESMGEATWNTIADTQDWASVSNAFKEDKPSRVVETYTDSKTGRRMELTKFHSQELQTPLTGKAVKKMAVEAKDKTIEAIGNVTKSIVSGIEKGKKKFIDTKEVIKKALSFRFGGREGQDAERISSNVAKIVALNPAMKDLIHISGSAFKAGGHDPMRITSGFRNREAQRKAMEDQRKNNPAQYKKNYSMGGTLTPSDTSTETWLNKRMSKHQHGNGIDVGYPKGIKGGTPRATAFVTSINNKLAAEGFDGLAVEEGNHIHMTAGGPKTKAQADKFERDFNAFKENDQGQRLKQANQGVNGAGVNGGVTVNNYNNQSYKKTDTSNLITSGGATDPSSTGHPSANAKQ